MMSEKIVITVEQNTALKSYKANKNTLDDYLVARSQFMNEFKTLRDFTIDEFAKLLYEPNSYEVEKPKFEVGDWVTRIKTNSLEKSERPTNHTEGRIFKIAELAKGYCYDDTDHAHHFGYIRHATKEEIIFAELGREVGEFIEGDVGRDVNGHLYRNVGTIKTIYNKSQLEGFYPESTYIKLP